MARTHDFPQAIGSARTSAGRGQRNLQLGTSNLNCGHCNYTLECVDQNRRSGTWLGSFICPNCRHEYFYAYRWGRLVRKS
jgi:hypothetical protein